MILIVTNLDTAVCAHREHAMEDEGRDGQAKEHQRWPAELRKPGGRQGADAPSWPQEGPALPTPQSQTSRPRPETVRSCVFKLPS